jgi:hypothetical protein
VLDELLGRMPRPVLAFVVAGGDVLDGDHLGHLGMTLDGVRRRDLRVARALFGLPSVWLPGGGYHAQAWQVLAGTVLALMRRSRRAIAPGDDPLTTRFSRLARHLDDLAPFKANDDLDLSDVEVELGMRARGQRHLVLGAYTAEAIEYALYRFGLLAFLERRGYGQFRVALGTATSGGERVSTYGHADGVEHLLMDLVLERRKLNGADEFLYVHWLMLRDPRARFGDRRPRLPGQDVPGLGLVREVSELLVVLAQQLELAGVAFRPAYYHTAAIAGPRGFRFEDPVMQGRFEAMARDFAGTSLAEISQAFAEGRVLENGAPCAWEPAEMVLRPQGEAPEREPIERERDRVRYEITVPDGTPVGVQAV